MNLILYKSNTNIFGKSLWFSNIYCRLRFIYCIPNNCNANKNFFSFWWNWFFTFKWYQDFWRNPLQEFTKLFAANLNLHLAWFFVKISGPGEGFLKSDFQQMMDFYNYSNWNIIYKQQNFTSFKTGFSQKRYTLLQILPLHKSLLPLFSWLTRRDSPWLLTNFSSFQDSVLGR